MCPGGKNNGSFSVRLKVWIENEEGELVIGMGRVAMLEAIKRSGSINQAAKELNMSYRALWGRLKSMEKRLGKKLLVKSPGGAKGGGTVLTPLAETLIERFRELNDRMESEARETFAKFSRDYMESDRD